MRLLSLFGLLFCFCVGGPAVDTVADHWTVSKVSDEWIVSFDGYHAPEERRRIVERAMPPGQEWRLVPRDNCAYELPSDFEVVHAKASVVHQALAREASITSVSPHQSIESSLLAAASQASSKKGVSPARKLRVASLWSDDFTGSGVKVAIFDTGLGRNAPYLHNVVERRDWTSERSLDDGVGHGTFIAGMVAGTNPRCMGMAPESQLYLFRVFTSRRVSFTAWFLDAFNYAIHMQMDVLNLSIGGPDFMDKPFTQKVAEVTSSGIVMVSAIGNDGPLWGTLNNPADMSPVVAVGGLGRSANHVALFSSRGMTTWQLPHGYGRVKPDVVTYSTQLIGPDRAGGCMHQSGTSMASPVVAGAIAVLISSLPRDRRSQIVNPASIKQVLVESAIRLNRTSMFEQGGGRLNLRQAVKLLQSYQPRLSFYPSYYDLSECPYFAPYCEQPLYHSAMPIILNATLLNGISVTGKILDQPIFVASNEAAAHLRLSFDWSPYVWPWTGHLGIRLTVAASGRTFDGLAEGVVSVRVLTPKRKEVTVELPLRVRIIPTPPRRQRFLWDQYHNARYPPGYFPRDDLEFTSSPFDWNADHPHTNFLTLFRHVRRMGYFLEVLGEPWTCFNASNYAALMVVDPEEEFWEEEQRKLESDIRQQGLSLIVLADWYNVEVMKALRFDDQNTQKQWTPVTGGAHLPALNDFLETFGVAFTTKVVRGQVTLTGRTFDYSSGSTLGAFPAGGHVLWAPDLYDQKLEIADMQTPVGRETHPIGGWFQVSGLSAGRILVMGDASFVDDAGRIPSKADKRALRGFWMLDDFISFANGGLEPKQVLGGDSVQLLLDGPLSLMNDANTPRRFHLANVLRFSNVLHDKQSGKEYQCAAYAVHVPSLNVTAPFDWAAAQRVRRAKAAHDPHAIIDPVVIAHILRPRKTSLADKWQSYSPLPWVLFLMGAVALPLFLWFQSKRESLPRVVSSREKLFSS